MDASTRLQLNDAHRRLTVPIQELVDLMNRADPHDLNGDGSTPFTFPYVTASSSG